MYSLQDVIDEYPEIVAEAIGNVVNANKFDSISMLALESPIIEDVLEDEEELKRLYDQESSLRCSKYHFPSQGEALFFVLLSQLPHLDQDVVRRYIPSMIFYEDHVLSNQRINGTRVIATVEEIIDKEITISTEKVDGLYNVPPSLVKDYLQISRLRNSGIALTSPTPSTIYLKGWLTEDTPALCDYKEWNDDTKDVKSILTNKLKAFKKMIDIYHFEQMYWSMFPEDERTFVRIFRQDDCFPTQDNPCRVDNVIVYSREELLQIPITETTVIREEINIEHEMSCHVVFCSFLYPQVITENEEVEILIINAIRVLDQRPLSPTNSNSGYDVVRIDLVRDGQGWRIYGTERTIEYPRRVHEYIHNQIISTLYQHKMRLVPVYYLNDKQVETLSNAFKTPSLMKYIGNGKVMSDEDIFNFLIQQRKSAYTPDNKYFDWCLVDDGQVVAYVSIRPYENNFQIRILSLVQRKGYATRAVNLAYHKFFEATGNRVLYAFVSQTNRPSNALFENLNWRKESSVKKWGGMYNVYISE